MIAKYCNMFSGIRFQIFIYTLDDEYTILSELKKRGICYKSVDEHPEAIYTGEAYDITAPLENLHVRELTYADYDMMEDYYRKKEGTLSSDRKSMLAERKELASAVYKRKYVSLCFQSAHKRGAPKGRYPV